MATTWLVLLLVAVVSAQWSDAALVFSLKVVHGDFGGSECITNPDERMNAYLAGMTGTVVVQVEYPDSVNLIYNGVTDWTWPKGLTVEAAITSDTTARYFSSSDDVYDKLNLRYVVDRFQAIRDSLWRSSNIVPPHGAKFEQPSYWFHHDVPR